MEKRTICSGAPFVTAGLAVLAEALVLGMGTLPGYAAAAAAGALGYVIGKKAFPDRVVEIERAPRSGNAEVDALIAEARTQLAAIARANDAIAERELSAQIDDIEATCRTILQRLEEQPNMLASLRTFLRYYLPATLKLLEERARLEREVAAGAGGDIAQKIRTAMAQVQMAFHKQLDALNEYRFINLESEMDVLSEMLAGDGLLAQEEQPAQPAPEEEDDPFAGLFDRGGK